MIFFYRAGPTSTLATISMTTLWICQFANMPPNHWITFSEIFFINISQQYFCDAHTCPCVCYKVFVVYWSVGLPLTCDRPRWTEAVSEMYMILPSGATTNTNPSKVLKNKNNIINNKCESESRERHHIIHLYTCVIVVSILIFLY